MVKRPSASVTLVSAVLLRNALLPIVLTELGIDTVFTDVENAKAVESIALTGLPAIDAGIVSVCGHGLAEQPVIVSDGPSSVYEKSPLVAADAGAATMHAPMATRAGRKASERRAGEFMPTQPNSGSIQARRSAGARASRCLR